MNKYRIYLHGFGDSTQFDMELSDGEFALVQKIVAESREASTYICEPTMQILALAEEEIEEAKQSNLEKTLKELESGETKEGVRYTDEFARGMGFAASQIRKALGD